MIAQVLRLTSWELFKLRKRWMPWILLAIAVVMTQLALWGDYSAYRNVGRYEDIWGVTFSEENSVSITVDITCVDVVEGNVDTKLALIPEPAPFPWSSRVSALEAVEEARASGHCEEVLERHAQERKRYREGLVLPSSLSNGLGVANFYGTLLIMILGALAMGVEYGYGTLRTALTRGIGRSQLLGAKVLSLLLLGGAGFIIVALFAAVSSVVFASLISGDGGGLADSGRWSTVVVIFGKAVYGLVPYIVLALFMSVLTSSSSMGIARRRPSHPVGLLRFIRKRRQRLRFWLPWSTGCPWQGSHSQDHMCRHPGWDRRRQGGDGHRRDARGRSQEGPTATRVGKLCEHP